MSLATTATAACIIANAIASLPKLSLSPQFGESAHHRIHDIQQSLDITARELEAVTEVVQRLSEDMSQMLQQKEKAVAALEADFAKETTRVGPGGRAIGKSPGRLVVLE